MVKIMWWREKQFIDALRIYEVQFEKLYINYLEYWIKEMNKINIIKI